MAFEEYKENTFKKKDNSLDKTYCVITEQGDLGLGADVLGPSDQKIMNENAKK